MMTITEKVAYLKGLADGVKLDDNTNEGKLIAKIIDVLEDMALTISDVEDTVGEMGQQIDEIDDDLAAIEDEWYDEDEDDEDFDGTIYEVECPTCHEIICLDEEQADEGEINCPACGEHLEFDFEECECGCDGCDHE